MPIGLQIFNEKGVISLDTNQTNLRWLHTIDQQGRSGSYTNPLFSSGVAIWSASMVLRGKDYTYWDTLTEDSVVSLSGNALTWRVKPSNGWDRFPLSEQYTVIRIFIS